MKCLFFKDKDWIFIKTSMKFAPAGSIEVIIGLGNGLVLNRQQAVTWTMLNKIYDTIWGIILGMGSANERRRYIVTSSLIGWAHTQNDPCISVN